MTITVQLGHSATIKLKFTDAAGNVVVPPTTGGSVKAGGTVALSADQQTVTYSVPANAQTGIDTISYTGPNGLTASETVNVVATLATAVIFDETTFSTS